jgi:predicted nucleic acid-binding protein
VAVRFLDTNVLLRHLLQDDRRQSPRATALLARIESGEEQVRVAESVVFETVFTLQRQYHVPKGEIRDKVLALLDLGGMILPGKRRLRDVFNLYVDLNMSFIDAYHVVLMKRLGIGEILSFDKGLDRGPGVSRVEP